MLASPGAAVVDMAIRQNRPPTEYTSEEWSNARWKEVAEAYHLDRMTSNLILDALDDFVYPFLKEPFYLDTV
jgi:hypothetical protein